MSQTPCNILFIHTDQQRRDLIGCYGDRNIATPNLDALAAEGVVFDNCFTPIPLCAPARASMLTGLLPIHHGLVRNVESGSVDGLDFLGKFPAFSEILSAGGYSCWHAGKWHVGTQLRAEDCGFRGVHYPGYGYPKKHPHYKDYLKSRGLPPFKLDREFHGTHRDGSQGSLLAALQVGPLEAAPEYYLTEQAIGMLREAAAAKQPFFGRIDFWGPHEPCIIPEPYYSLYDGLRLEPWPNFKEDFAGKPRIQRDYVDYWSVQDFAWEDWMKVIRAYYGYATMLDHQIGRLLAALKALGLYEQTAIFFTSDHGGMLGAHRLCDKGPFLYDEVLRVPFIARVPGVTRLGGREAGWIYNYDLMPTFLELAGMTAPAELDARSILPVLRGEQQREELMFGEFHGHHVPVSLRVVRTGDWKYIFNGADVDELYDLKHDPSEMVNRASDPQCLATLREMRERLRKRMEEVNDPVLRYFEKARVRS